MQFFIFVLIFCLVLFLFRLYHLGNDDYILIKKNISLEQIFNSAIICSIIALFFARVFYVFSHPLPVYLSPLGFLLFPYFPGLSLTGGVLGGAVGLFIYARKKRFPVGRVFDFFSLSLLFSLPLGQVGYFLLSQDITKGAVVRLIMYVLMLLSANIYFYPKIGSLQIKDGTSSLLFLIFFSLILLLTNAIDNPGTYYFLSHKENFVLVGSLILGIVLLLKQEITGRIGNGK